MHIGKWRDAYEIKIGRLIRCDSYEETGEMYSFECFIKSRIKGCVRASIAEEQGLTVNRSRQLYTITKIRSAIAFDNQMEEENVSVEMIYQRLEQEAEEQKKRPM